MSKVVLSGCILVPESELRQVKAALAKHILLTRAESGCLVFNVTACPSDKTRFDVYEEFESAAAFKFHQQRVATSSWGTCTKNVTRYYNIEGLDE
ncbi:MAG: antibiotic biosynthesis monooxygenase [Opitutaceae bacterium]|mgnify:CR=1 FL=1|jgi:(4S)-4-hydroxy-5-phosphonooxypentane-2,3-dione isomerase|nr:antibiotic biosynthesis monooxygenase [Opitutaceae bacterium]